MYMGYIATEENMPDDNPPIGIILSKEKDELFFSSPRIKIIYSEFVPKQEVCFVTWYCHRKL